MSIGTMPRTIHSCSRSTVNTLIVENTTDAASVISTHAHCAHWGSTHT
jgi:hypothetical protein